MLFCLAESKLKATVAFALLTLVLFSPLANRAEAKPLATFSSVEEGDTRVRVDFISDVYNSPYQNKETPQRVYELQLKVPFIKSDRWRTSFTVDGEGRSVGRPDLTVGYQQVQLGPDLRTQAVGFAFDYRDPDKSSFALYLSYDSASDEPYKTKRDISVASVAVYTSAPVGVWQWIVGTNQNENRGYANGQFLPVLGLVYQPSAHLRVAFGFPFVKLNWEYADDNYMKLTAMPAGFRNEFVHYIWPDISIYAAVALTNRSYEHFNRIDEDMRLIFEEKNIEAGFRMALSKSTIYGLVVGYAFDRRIFEGKQVFAPIGPVDRLNSDFYAGINLEYLF